MKDRWDIPDEEFDGLFREAFEKIKPPYDPEAWHRMQTKLDGASLPSKAPTDNRLLTRSLLAVLLLLLLSASYLVYNLVKQPISDSSVGIYQPQLRPKSSMIPNKSSAQKSANLGTNAPLEIKKEKENNSGAQQTVVNELGQAVDRSQPEYAEAKNSNKVLIPDVKAESTSKNDKSEQGNSKFEVSKNGNFPKESKLQKTNNQADNVEVSANVNKIDQHKNQNTNKTVIVFNKQSDQATRQNLSSKSLLPIIETEQVGSDEKQNRLNRNQIGKQVQRSDNQLDKELSLTNELPLDVNQERWMLTNLNQLNSKLAKISVAFSIPSITAVARPVAELPVKPVVITRPKFGLRLLMAPDVNRVGSSNPFALGDSYGMLIEYQFINRLRVQVGAVRTVKKYVSGTADYNNPSGFWTYGVKPATIEADCKILDLPLNIRWDAIRRTKYDLFINSGLSSYLMLNERYDYKYAPPYDKNTHLKQSWEKSRGSDHFFSTLNLSVGYERQLQKGLTVQIEPYLKLPVKGVGFAAVDIYSTGLLISGKYQFGWKKR